MPRNRIKEPFEHWPELVEVFFEFCRNNFDGQKPSFTGSAPRDMKEILIAIRKRAEEKKIPWVLSEAEKRWRTFLIYAFSDRWLKDHWTLSNINRQKDALFFRASSLISQKSSKKEVSTSLPDQSVYDLMN